MSERGIKAEQKLIFIETMADQFDWAMAPIREDLDSNISFIHRILAQPEISVSDLAAARVELEAIQTEHVRLEKQIAPILAQQRREFYSLFPDSEPSDEGEEEHM